MTPNQITMLIILIAYMAVVLAVGLYASRRVKGSEDFLLAGRSMGLFVLVGTLCATQLGGGNIIGTSTNGYNQGLSGMTFGVSTGLAMLVLGLLMAKPMRKMGLCTISDFVYNRYQSNTARAHECILRCGSGRYPCRPGRCHLQGADCIWNQHYSSSCDRYLCNHSLYSLFRHVGSGPHRRDPAYRHLHRGPPDYVYWPD